jgi:hypothetical protein
MTQRRNVWLSRPGTTGFGRHQLAVVRDGLMVTRTVTFPAQPDREPLVVTYTAPDEMRADLMFTTWTSIAPKGYQLVESTDNPATEKAAESE